MRISFPHFSAFFRRIFCFPFQILCFCLFWIIFTFSKFFEIFRFRQRPPAAFIRCGRRPPHRKPSFEGRWRGAPEDRMRRRRITSCERGAPRRATLVCMNHAGCFPAELLSRDYFLSSPWKKESSKERRRRQIEIFLCSGARTFVLETFYKHRASQRQTSLRSFASGVALCKRTGTLGT